MIYESTITYLGHEGKQVKEQYIVDNQDLFAQVEERLYKEFNGFKAFDVLGIKRSKIKEIANARIVGEERIWMSEVEDTFTNDEGEEKAIRYKIVFFSPTFDSAKDFIKEYLKQGFGMTLISLKLTPFVDVLL